MTDSFANDLSFLRSFIAYSTCAGANAPIKHTKTMLHTPSGSSAYDLAAERPCVVDYKLLLVCIFHPTTDVEDDETECTTWGNNDRHIVKLTICIYSSPRL